MSAHTPGPWIVNRKKAVIDVPNDDTPICGMLWPTELRGEDETRANARLIAAAPDISQRLAETQELLLSVMPYAVEDHRLSIALQAQFAANRDAIAKATGEQA